MVHDRLGRLFSSVSVAVWVQSAAGYKMIRCPMSPHWLVVGQTGETGRSDPSQVDMTFVGDSQEKRCQIQAKPKTNLNFRMFLQLLLLLLLFFLFCCCSCDFASFRADDASSWNITCIHQQK